MCDSAIATRASISKDEQQHRGGFVLVGDQAFDFLIGPEVAPAGYLRGRGWPQEAKHAGPGHTSPLPARTRALGPLSPGTAGGHWGRQINQLSFFGYGRALSSLAAGGFVHAQVLQHKLIKVL